MWEEAAPHRRGENAVTDAPQDREAGLGGGEPFGLSASHLPHLFPQVFLLQPLSA